MSISVYFLQHTAQNENTFDLEEGAVSRWKLFWQILLIEAERNCCAAVLLIIRE